MDSAPDGEWPYADKLCYVYSREPRTAMPGIEFVDERPELLLQRISAVSVGRVWLMGGGEIIRLFLQNGLVDIFDLFYVPVLLGGGVSLFPAGFPMTELVLEKSVSCGGMVEMIYTRKGRGK